MPAHNKSWVRSQATKAMIFAAAVLPVTEPRIYAIETRVARVIHRVVIRLRISRSIIVRCRMPIRIVIPIVPTRS